MDQPVLQALGLNQHSWPKCWGKLHATQDLGEGDDVIESQRWDKARSRGHELRDCGPAFSSIVMKNFKVSNHVWGFLQNYYQWPRGSQDYQSSKNVMTCDNSLETKDSKLPLQFATFYCDKIIDWRLVVFLQSL